METKIKKDKILSNKDNSFLPKTWKSPKEGTISCTEKIKLLNENVIEIKRMTDDAIEDAILMGADPKQVINILKKSFENYDS